MNARIDNQLYKAGLCLAATGALVLGGSAIACDEYETSCSKQQAVQQAVSLAMLGDEDEQRTHSVFVERVNGVFGTTSHEIKVEITDGEPIVWIDGEVVDTDRLRREDGRIIVLDENGDEMRSVRIWEMGDEPFQWEGDFHLDMDGEPMAVRVQGDGFFDTEPPPVMLGVYMESPSPALQSHLKLKEGKATIITGVYEGLSAHAAGLKEHDIIVAIDGDDDAGPARLREVLREREAGDPIELTIIHEGRRQTVEVELEAYDRERMHAAKLRGHSARQSQFRELLVSPFGPDRDDEAVFVAPNRGNSRIDMDEIHGIIQEALHNAMRHTDGAVKLDMGELHERLRVDHEDVDRHMQMLHEHMEQIHRMMERLERRLHREHMHDDDDEHDDIDRDDDV